MSETDTIKLDSVEAIFGGRTRRFWLPKDSLAVASLEAAIGSPFAAFARFQAGAWTIKDVRMVLAHAFPGARLMHGITRVEAIDAALVARPVATYAPLAVKILEAFLFGIEANAASFDEARIL